MANRKHLINVHTSTGTTAPTEASLYLGEIAVQHTPNEPAIWIKMGSAETSTEYEKFVGETEIINLLEETKILGSGYTYSGLSYIDSSTTIADAFSALTNELIKDEKVTAAALNDLNVKTNEIDSIKQIIREDEEVTAGAINLLNERVAGVETHMSGDYIQITGYELASGSTEEELTLREEDTVNEAFGKLQKQMLDNEEAIAAGLNDLNSKVDDLEEQIEQNTGVTQLSGAVMTLSAATVASVMTLSAGTVAGFEQMQEYVDNGLSNKADNTDLEALSAGTVHDIAAVSAKTAGILTLNLNGVEQGQYCPSASTVINLEAIQEITGADVLLTGYELASGSTEEELVVLASDTVNEAFGKLQKQNYDNEAVVAGALNDLDERVAALEAGGSVEPLSAATIALSAATVTLSSSTNADIQAISADTIELSAVTVTNSGNVAALSAATTGLSAATVVISNNVTALSAATTGISNNLNTLSAATVALSSATKADIQAVSADTIALSAATETISGNVASLSGATTGISGNVTALSASTVALSAASEDFFDSAEYVSSAKTIVFKNGNVEKASIDATEFIKDGMVSAVTISGGSMIISFNTDAGREDITLELTDIFDPSNYYTKDEINNGVSASTAALSAATTGISRNVTALSAATTGLSAATVMISNNVNTLSAATTGLSSNLTALSAATTDIESGLETLSGVVIDNELVTAEALINLNNGLDTLSGAVIDMSYVVATSLNDLNNKENALSAGTVAAITDLEGKIDELSGNTGFDGFEEITWSALKTLRDSSGLTPGKQYRITDYNTTTSQEDTQAAGHQFDIIVVADDVNKLNENARAVLHDGDTYFSTSGANLNAWEIKYSLDNDTKRFYWAVTGATGRGVIYHMKDEWNNECPYDFKNIQFKRKLTDGEYDTGGVETFVYTFNAYDSDNETISDASIIVARDVIDDGTQYCFSNVIKLNYRQYTASNIDIYKLNDIVFLNLFSLSNESYFECIFNTFGNDCHSNTFGNSCNYNTFGNKCDSNTFGNTCNYNTFGNSCYSNTFENRCYSNTFGNRCHSNTFGHSCDYNTFENSCYSNTFGNSCDTNTFGNDCHSNTFGNDCNYNTFGIDCSQIIFNKDYISNVMIENGNQYITLTSTQTPTGALPLRNITIAQGVNNGVSESSRKTISHNTLNDEFKTTYQSANSQVINI